MTNDHYGAPSDLDRARKGVPEHLVTEHNPPKLNIKCLQSRKVDAVTALKGILANTAMCLLKGTMVLCGLHL